MVMVFKLDADGDSGCDRGAMLVALSVVPNA